jgi:hypothetical protein
MIENTIGEIETRIQQTGTVSAEQKLEMLHLLETLKIEVNALAKTNAAQADSITGFTQISTHEAIRPDPNPQLRELSVRGLRSSVSGFERSHPTLVRIVNNISNTLANLGI